MLHQLISPRNDQVTPRDFHKDLVVVAQVLSSHAPVDPLDVFNYPLDDDKRLVLGRLIRNAVVQPDCSRRPNEVQVRFHRDPQVRHQM